MRVGSRVAPRSPGASKCPHCLGSPALTAAALHTRRTSRTNRHFFTFHNVFNGCLSFVLFWTLTCVRARVLASRMRLRIDRSQLAITLSFKDAVRALSLSLHRRYDLVHLF